MDFFLTVSVMIYPACNYFPAEDLLEKVKKIGFVVKQDEKARRKADELEEWLENKGIAVIRKESRFNPAIDRKTPEQAPPDDLSCIFVLGGDGTFLSASRWIGDSSIPILGIKFGEVGFLAETVEDDLFKAAEAVIENKFQIHPRMRLTIEIRREGRQTIRETVLNDVVINKDALARLARITTEIDGKYLTTYTGDGLIIATPTGSTAYSLAAGGPVIHPSVEGIILTPICPFTLTNRPLIIPESSVIRTQLCEKATDIMLTFDGQKGVEIMGNDEIIIRKSDHPIQMIILPNQNYFDVLKAKLRWSGGR